MSEKAFKKTLEQRHEEALEYVDSKLQPLLDFAQSYGKHAGETMRTAAIDNFNYSYERKGGTSPERAWTESLLDVGGFFYLRLVGDELRKSVEVRVARERLKYDAKESIWAILCPEVDEEPTHELFGFSEPLTPIDLIEIFREIIFRAFPSEMTEYCESFINELTIAMEDNDINPENQKHAHPFLHQTILPLLIEDGTHELNTYLNSLRELPESLKIENFPVRHTKLDEAFEKFCRYLPKKHRSSAKEMKGELYEILAYERPGIERSRSRVLQILKKELAGKIISTLILEGIRENLREETGDPSIYPDLESLVQDLKDLDSEDNTLAEFLIRTNTLDLTDQIQSDDIKSSIYTLFKDGLTRTFSSTQNSTLARATSNVLDKIFNEFFITNTFNSKEDLEYFIIYIIRMLETFGNKVFSKIYNKEI